MTYDYRMFAVGEEGDSLASNMVTVVSPADDSSSGAGAFDFIGMLFLLLLGGLIRKTIS